MIQVEKIVENGIERYTRCRSVIDQAKKGKIEVVCSGLCLAEVCKPKDVQDADPKKIADYFEHDYVMLVSLGREIGERARNLMMVEKTGLYPQDACHVATALMTPDVVELHTFDKDILKLDGKLNKADNTPLRICLPDVGGSPIPLLGT